MDFAFGPPPPGGDKNRGSIILALDGIIFGTSWTMVLLRLVTRTWITRNLGWDDATIFFAALTNSVGLGFYISMVLYGLGRHKYYLSDYDYKMLLKWDYLDWPQTFLTLAVSKISICLLLLRLSQFSKLKKVLHWLVLFIVATHLPLMVLMIVQCRPVEKAWNTAMDGTCLSKNMIGNILIAQGFFSILIDFIGAAFPVLLLWNVKIKIGSKVAIWLLMGFGVVTSVACIVRTSLTYQIKSKDLSWDGVGISIAKMLEVNFGIIAACLPIMKPLYTYTRALYTGIPFDQRRHPSNLTQKTAHTISSFPSHHHNWYRLHSPRSLISPLQASKQHHHDGAVVTGDASSGHPAKRQSSWKAWTKGQREDGSLELPMQGIERTPVRSSDDADAKSSTRADLGDGASKAQVALDEIL